MHDGAESVETERAGAAADPLAVVLSQELGDAGLAAGVTVGALLALGNPWWSTPTVPENLPRTQGAIDVLVALAGAGGGVMSGVVMAAAGWRALSLAGGVLAPASIPVLAWSRRAP